MHVCFRKDIRWKPGSVTVAIVESDRYSMVKVGDIVVACNDRRDPESIQRALQRRDMARCLEILRPLYPEDPLPGAGMQQGSRP